MQYLKICNTVIGRSLVFMLLGHAVLANAAGYGVQQLSTASTLIVAEQTNPWLLPEPRDESLRYPGFRSSPRDRQNPVVEQHRSGRFVTPDVLQALKQQQTRTQMMPESNQSRRQQGSPRPSISSQQFGQGTPGFGYGTNPGYGMVGVDPIYDTPLVSPWGSGPDVMYRGESFPDSFSESFPWVPNEAIGGIPPIHIPPYSGSEFGTPAFGSQQFGRTDAAGRGDERGGVEDNVFNPFTFIPNRNLH